MSLDHAITATALSWLGMMVLAALAALTEGC